MRKLIHLAIRPRHAHEVKSRSARDGVNARLVRRKKMHSVAGGRIVRPSCFAQERLLLVHCIRRLIHGVDAHDQHLVILPRLQRSLRQPGSEAMLHLRTQHRALIVNLGHHHRFIAEPAAQRPRAARLVGKDRGHRKRLPQPLFNTRMRQIRRRLLRGHAYRLVCRIPLRA